MKNNKATTRSARRAIKNLKVYDCYLHNLQANCIRSTTAAQRLATAANKSGLSPQEILSGWGVLLALANGRKTNQINTPDLVQWLICDYDSNTYRRKWL